MKIVQTIEKGPNCGECMASKLVDGSMDCYAYKLADNLDVINELSSQALGLQEHNVVAPILRKMLGKAISLEISDLNPRSTKLSAVEEAMRRCAGFQDPTGSDSLGNAYDACKMPRGILRLLDEAKEVLKASAEV